MAIRTRATTEVVIPKMDMSRLRPDFTVLIVGKRGTGKTTVVRDICYHMEKHTPIPLVMAVSPTEDTNASLGQFIPKCLVHSTLRPDLIAKLMEEQRSANENGKNRAALLILDDCAYNRKALAAKSMVELFMNGRHRRLGVIVTTQYLLSVPPQLRANVDLVVALKDNSVNTRKKLWAEYFGMYDTYGSFCRVFDAVAQNHDALVLLNGSGGGVFWHRAQYPARPFRMMRRGGLGAVAHRVPRRRGPKRKEMKTNASNKYPVVRKADNDNPRATKKRHRRHW